MQIVIIILILCACTIGSTHTLQMPTGPALGMPQQPGAAPDGMNIPGMPPMDEKEMAEFMNFLGEFDKYYRELPPEQRDVVDKGARYDLIINNINPDTLQPLTPAERQKMEATALKEFEQAEATLRATEAKKDTLTPQTDAITSTSRNEGERESDAKAEQASDCSLVTTHSIEQVSCLLQNGITHIEIMRQKLALMTTDVSILQERLNTILFYLKSLNKPEHLPRLASETFDRLYTMIAQLTKILKKEESQIITLHEQAEPTHTNPYDILGIPYSATQEQIEAQYQQKKAEYDPATIEKNLEAAGVSSEKIARRLRQAKLHTATIEDAYDRLSNRELRYQIDRFYTIDREQREALYQTTEQAIDRLDSALEAIIQEGFISELERFFARYETVERDRKKQMERAESQRHEELQAYERMQPTLTPPVYNRYPQEQTGYPMHSNSGFNPFAQPFTPPQPSAFTPTPSIKQSPSSGGQNKPAEVPKKGKDEPPKKKESAPKAEPKAAKDTKKETKGKTEKAVKQKPKADTVESLTTEFIQKLEKLDKISSATEEIIKAPEHTPTKQTLKNRAVSTPTQFDEELKTFVTKTLSNPILQHHADLAKFMTRVKKIKAQNALRPLWDAYYNQHQLFYETIEQLNTLRTTRFPTTTTEGLPLSYPWNSISELHAHIKAVTNTFKPKAEKKPKPADDGSTPVKEKSKPKPKNDKKKPATKNDDPINSQIAELPQLFEELKAQQKTATDTSATIAALKQQLDTISHAIAATSNEQQRNQYLLALQESIKPYQELFGQLTIPAAPPLEDTQQPTGQETPELEESSFKQAERVIIENLSKIEKKSKKK